MSERATITKGEIVDGIEWFTVHYMDGTTEDDCQCARCGSSCYRQDCWDCGGEGYRSGDELTAGYDFDWIDPDEMYDCRTCRGKGGWWRCISGREWCEANPMPGREHIESTARAKGEDD